MAVLGVQISTSGLIPNTSGLGLGLTQQMPTPIFINTNDTLATVTTTGYLTQSHTNFQYPYNNYQLAEVYTTDNGTVWLRVSVTFSGGNAVYSLVAPSESGTITTPTVANQIAYATNTLGTLAATGLSTALFNAGNLSAGLSGTAGALYSFASAATSGKLGLVGVANSGNFTVNISNASYGQASTVSFADVGSAAGRFLVANTATPFTSGNIPKASGTGGLMVDAGIGAANLMVLNAVNTMAAASQIILDKGTGTESSNAVTINKMSGVITTTSLTTAGGATETITLTNSEVAANSVVLASIGNGGVGGNTATNAYTLSTTVSLHTVVFVITNTTAATALNGTLVINFAVF